VDPVQGSARYVATALAHESRISFGNVALWTEDGELEFHEPAVEGFISHSATNMHATPVSFVAPARSISSLRTELGWPAIDMIKISAEGSEYAILESLLAGDERIPLVCVEFAQPAPLSRVLEAVAAMRGRGYEIVARSARPRNWKMSFVHPGYAAEADRGRQDDPGARTTTRV
jgi:FkbM family methyltransferase